MNRTVDAHLGAAWWRAQLRESYDRMLWAIAEHVVGRSVAKLLVLHYVRLRVAQLQAAQ